MGHNAHGSTPVFEKDPGAHRTENKELVIHCRKSKRWFLRLPTSFVHACNCWRNV